MASEPETSDTCLLGPHRAHLAEVDLAGSEKAPRLQIEALAYGSSGGLSQILCRVHTM